ncbi:NADH-quinone oxidoreductase subunit A [Adhaeretor mobilis]|uniref:NADH-quinone oxidoreductase subunit n=1 Tax=Adhaeretor mobilis TaxID=1930276 RepID=A0A517MV09_9BACT|nr:NADH-quinone oxidoreductase subunit A [Adhaeretor mobilis]QDS98720.1 NAD(P)H-quinone oxidoreductase subunit 3 [Adhaeretor mobilis]
MATPTAIVAYLGLFAAVAGIFLFVNLLVGRFLRPNLPNEEKLEIYECGEPTIGSSFVQFDLRFYVIALLFIIFDVEVAFFFPWASVYGKATQLSSPNMPVVMADLDPGGADDKLSPQATIRLEELGLRSPELPALSAERSKELGVVPGTVGEARAAVRDSAQTLAKASIFDISVFFAVLMVGFAYVWKRGDLNWVHSTESQKGQVVERAPPTQSTDRAARTAGSILSA